MSDDREAPSTWWGDYELEDGQTIRWRIGPLEIWVLDGGREWRLACISASDDEERDPEWEVDLDASMPEEAVTLERYVFRKATHRLRLRPALADRAVVTSPRIPLFLLQGEEARLFVGSPLWLRIEVGSPWKLIREIPIRRPSDTWIGSTTREGEVCYATRTRAGLDPGALPLLSRRALTAMRIQNRAAEPLQIERLKLPVPMLSLYESDSRRLWTEAVTLVREEAGEMARLEVHSGAPRDAGDSRILTPAREKPDRALLIRAFSSLFRFGPEEETE